MEPEKNKNDLPEAPAFMTKKRAKPPESDEMIKNKQMSGVYDAMTKRKGLLFYLRYAVLISLGLMILFNLLANFWPFKGQTVGQISDGYHNLFTPAGLTFSIWSVIYLLLVIFAVYYFIKGGKIEGVLSEKWPTLGILFVITCLLNIAWTITWQLSLVGTTVIINLLLLASLICLFLYFKKWQTEMKLEERFLVQLPFTIYFGWISVANLANIAALVADRGSTLAISQWFTIGLLLVGLLLGIGITYFYKEVAYGLVIIWAYIGIFIKHVSIFEKQYLTVILVVAFSLFFLGLIVLIVLYGQLKQKIGRQKGKRLKKAVMVEETDNPVQAEVGGQATNQVDNQGDE